MNLSKFFIDRPIFAGVLSVLIFLLLGLAASLGLPALAGFWAEFLTLLSAWQPATDRTLFKVLAAFAALGAVLLVAADLVAQFAIPGLSMPVGVVTGAIGAVFLLWLLATSKGRQL